MLVTLLGIVVELVAVSGTSGFLTLVYQPSSKTAGCLCASRALEEHVKDKPDLIYAAIKMKPELCRERRSSRRQGRSG
jgi:hypothetical protein